jgi:ParB family chromosome partitioning protein
MSTLREIRVDLIDDGINVREKTDPGLIASIHRHGVLQPIVVRATGRRFEVVMGYRRLAAARLVGLQTIPAVVEEARHDDQLLRQVAENVHRRAMNPIDVARALKAHLDAHPGMKKAELAAALGYPGAYGPVWISNKLALLRMDDAVIAKLEAGEVTESQAIGARQRLGDGRGRPRVIPLEAEEGRSRSVSVPIGRHVNLTGRVSAGVADISVDRETGSVDVAIQTGDRGLFLTLSPAEARLLGRRLQQAGDALQVVA